MSSLYKQKPDDAKANIAGGLVGNLPGLAGGLAGPSLAEMALNPKLGFSKTILGGLIK